MTDFSLHSRLSADTHLLGDFPLCRLLVMNDVTYPWFILVPRRAAIREIHELTEADQHQLLRESSQLGQQLEKVFKADKLNVAALGNLVPQLHLHHIVRYQDDPCWPAPVWGKSSPVPYATDRLQELCRPLLALLIDFIPAERFRSG